MWKGTIAFLLVLTTLTNINAQELEPRLLTNVPIKSNFLVVNYGYLQGSMLLDPSIPIDDLEAKLNSFIIGYARSFSLFGLSSKVDAVIPAAKGNWKGKLNGENRTRNVTGFGDPRIRLSVNFRGAPATPIEDYPKYKQKTISGASLQVFLPFGHYDPDKLVNLGGNRFVFKPQLGWSYKKKTWIFESYVSLWVFTKNSDFYGGNTLEQEPMISFKQHFIHTFKNRMWMSLDAGYALGGQSRINDILTDSRISTIKVGAVLAYPFAKQHTLKLVLGSAIRIEKGPDYDNISLSYQFRWLDKKRE